VTYRQAHRFCFLGLPCALPSHRLPVVVDTPREGAKRGNPSAQEAFVKFRGFSFAGLGAFAELFLNGSCRFRFENVAAVKAGISFFTDPPPAEPEPEQKAKPRRAVISTIVWDKKREKEWNQAMKLASSSGSIMKPNAKGLAGPPSAVIVKSPDHATPSIEPDPVPLIVYWIAKAGELMARSETTASDRSIAILPAVRRATL
jgi:hypothetical protein